MEGDEHRLRTLVAIKDLFQNIRTRTNWKRKRLEARKPVKKSLQKFK